MIEDSELLRQYAKEGNQAAFAEIVQRHLNLVYSTALRQVGGDADLAKDVSQSVFTDLARKSGSLSQRSVLTGWLYTSTHFAAAKIVRTERRRAAREQEAHAMQQLLHDSSSEADWNALSPALDDLMHQLSESDREAVLLRYFENRPFAEVGAKLGIGENAARMRVDRAVEKLRGLFKQHGVTISGVTLTAAISANAVSIAPIGLAAVFTSGAIAGTSALNSTGSIFAAFMKTKTVAAVALLGIVAGTIFLWPSSSAPEKSSASLKTNISATSPVSDAQKLFSRQTAVPENARRLLARHNESLQANETAKKNSMWKLFNEKFDPSELEDEPGVRKFHGIIPSRLSAGETLVTGGWMTEPGKRVLVFVTPVFDTNNLESNQILIETQIAEADEKVLEEFGVKTDGRESGIYKILTSAVMKKALAAMKAKEGLDLLNAPRISTVFDTPAVVSICDQKTIAGKKQDIGPSIGVATSDREGNSAFFIIGSRITLEEPDFK